MKVVFINHSTIPVRSHRALRPPRRIDSIRRRREEKAQRRGAGAPAKGFRRMSGLKRRASGRIPAMPPRLRAQSAQAELDPRPNALVTVIEEQFGHQLGAADRG